MGDDGELELTVVSFLSVDILSAIMLLIVLIHFAFTPTFEPSMSPQKQKNLARACPIIDFLLLCKVQLSVCVLSVTHRTTGCGSSLTFQDANKHRGMEKQTDANKETKVKNQN